MINDSAAFHKYRELTVLNPFCNKCTVNGEKISFAFGDDGFRYWNEGEIVEFDLTNARDISRFLNTEFVMHVGEVKV